MTRRRARARGESIGDHVFPVQLDVADPAGVLAAAAAVEDRFGRTDVLVNNAAILYDTENRAESVDLEVVHRGFETNLFGAWRTSQAFLPLLRKSDHGRIVNVSSRGGSLASMARRRADVLGLEGRVERAHPPARRRAGLAIGILVNSVCPGWVATDMGGRGGRPVEEGAASVVWAATLPDDGPTGGFFRDGRPVPW